MLARVDALAESLRSSAEPLVTGHRFKDRWELIACDATPGSALDAVAASWKTLLVLEERGMLLDPLAAYGAGVQVHVEDLAAHLAGRERCDAEARWNELSLPTRTWPPTSARHGPC